MVEPIMYFGIGFLVASLLGLVLIPLVHNRAVRLTIRRLEAATPLSMAEIQADKDQLRAEFAMSTRRLEISVEQLKARTTSQLAELGKKTEAINRLKSELSEKASTIFALEARERSLRDQSRTTEEEVGERTHALHEASRVLSDKEAELAKLTAALGERTFLSDSQRVEIVSLRTQVDTLKAQIDRFQKELEDSSDRLDYERGEVSVAAQQLEDERGRVGVLGSRAAELERALFEQTSEVEALNQRLHDVEARLAEQGHLLVERDYETAQLRRELEGARRLENDLRSEIVALERRHDQASGGLRGENALLEGELERTREERSRLQHEIANLKRETEATWANERVENALLRERINDIATEVARLTMVLEGPGSPIEAMLAGQTDPVPSVAPEAGRNGRSPAPEIERGGNLADRIRALQARASRIAPAGARNPHGADPPHRAG
jgi:chromosome segregation ATPase